MSRLITQVITSHVIGPWLHYRKGQGITKVRIRPLRTINVCHKRVISFCRAVVEISQCSGGSPDWYCRSSSYDANIAEKKKIANVCLPYKHYIFYSFQEWLKHPPWDYRWRIVFWLTLVHLQQCFSVGWRERGRMRCSKRAWGWNWTRAAVARTQPWYTRCAVRYWGATNRNNLLKSNSGTVVFLW